MKPRYQCSKCKRNFKVMPKRCPHCNGSSFLDRVLTATFGRMFGL